MLHTQLEIERFLVFAHGQVQGETWRAMSEVSVEDGEGMFYSSTYDLLASKIASTPNCRAVLDVACGDGRLLELVSNRVATTVSLHGIDISPDELRCARTRLTHRATFHTARAQSLPFASATFDCVTSHMALMLMENEDAVASEIARVLAPEGVLHALVAAAPEKCEVHDLFEAQLRGVPRTPQWENVRFRSRGFSSPEAIRNTLWQFPNISVQSLQMTKSGTPEDAWAWFGGMYDLLVIGEDQAAAVKARFIASCKLAATCGKVFWSIPVTYICASRTQRTLERTSAARSRAQDCSGSI